MDKLTTTVTGNLVIGEICPNCGAKAKTGIHICGKDGERVFLMAESVWREFIASRLVFHGSYHG